MDNPKKNIDWFLDKTASKQVLVILILIIGYLGFSYYKTQKETLEKLEELSLKVKSQEAIISSLEKDLQETKFSNILSNANQDTSPVPMWLVDVKTNKMLWVNVAYEKKYLLPKLTTREEFIGTDGAYVFGELEVLKFHDNNRLVFNKQRPLTFKDEVNTTITKFPVKVGDYTYAIGGMEYIIFQ